MDERRLRIIFRRELTRFMAKIPGPAVKLVLTPRKCPRGTSCGVRDFGYCSYGEGPPKIVFIRRILGLPEANIVGLIRHELGHAFDPYIGESGAEQRADDIAEWVTGQRINYDKDDIQTIGRGTYPRPLYLHR